MITTDKLPQQHKPPTFTGLDFIKKNIRFFKIINKDKPRQWQWSLIKYGSFEALESVYIDPLLFLVIPSH